MESILFLIISFLASTVGAICGIGGGVIIKPTLDFFKMADVATISFLSGCTVLAMSCYSVGRGFIAKEKMIDLKTAAPLSIGAAIGGILGKELFTLIKNSAPNANLVGGIQAACLAALTIMTLVYTLLKSRIKTHELKGIVPCVLIGCALGLLSSFLGIGGGPINLVVLAFFFSMPTKKAAANSLFIILFSQLASLIMTLVTRTVPAFRWQDLLLMIAGGILGGVVGRIFSKKMSEKAVDVLFIILMCIIILISIYNTWHYFSL